MAVILTEEQLQAKCLEWQKLLRLQDWHVKVYVKRDRDLMLGKKAGVCRWTIAKKMAIIQVLDPTDYDPDTPWEQDMELTLVHELLHLHLAPFDNFEDSPLETAVEQAVESISEGLVTLRRAQKEK